MRTSTLRAVRPVEPEPARPPVETTSERKGVQLQPIPWGEPDEHLGRILLRHIVEATPPTIVPFNPRIEHRLRSDLRKARASHF